MTHEHNRAKGPLARLRMTFLPNCREMSRHSSRSLDARLTLFQRLGVGLHLIFCRFCRRYWRQLHWLRLTAQKSADANPAIPPLSDRARSRLKQSLREQGTTANAQGAGAASPSADPEENHDDCR